MSLIEKAFSTELISNSLISNQCQIQFLTQIHCTVAAQGRMYHNLLCYTVDTHEFMCMGMIDSWQPLAFYIGEPGSRTEPRKQWSRSTPKNELAKP